MPFFVVLILIIVGSVGVDQLTKWIVFFNSESLESDPISIIGLFKLTYVENDGMAFGWLSDHRWVFIVASIIGIIAISVYLFRFSKDTRLTKIGLALVLGGGIGNMIDRTVLGFVIDMIQMSFLGSLFPWVFNVADSCVCVGVGVAVLGIILETIKEYKAEKKKSAVPCVEGSEADGDSEADDNGKVEQVVEAKESADDSDQQ